MTITQKDKSVEEAIKSQGLAFPTTKITNTHQWITVQGFKVLENDLPFLKLNEKEMIVFNKIKQKFSVVVHGSILPDYGKVGVELDGCDYELYQDHFFNYLNGKNFTATSKWYLAKEIKDTAESQARQYSAKAKAFWILDKDEDTALTRLGQCLHYFEDTNEPHHCLLWTGGSGTAHTTYEMYAEKYKENCGINTIEDKTLYHQFEDMNYSDFVSKMEFKHSELACKHEPLVSMKNTYEDWNKSIKLALKTAQEGVAVMFYRFIKEVANETKHPVNNTLGKVHFVVKIADEKNSGTDDYIYFGIKMKDEKEYEYLCDQCGNDFERNSIGTYQFTVDSSIKYENIKHCYIKKARHTAFDDQAKIERMELYIQGERVAKVSPNKWLRDSNGERRIDFKL